MPSVRRVLRAGLLIGALASATVASVTQWGGIALARERDLMLVYVGADDCVPCRIWQRDVGASFRDAPGFQRIAYREVKSPTLFEVLKDENWPDDLRGYRAQLGRGAGVPMWLVIADHEIVGRGYGASQWQSTVLPKLQALSR